MECAQVFGQKLFWLLKKGGYKNDKIILDSNGNLQFHNIQCCDCTGEHGSFEFVTTKGYWGDEVEFGDVWDILNIYKEYLEISKFKLDEEYNEVLNQLKTIFDKAIELREREKEQMMQDLFKEMYKEKTEKEIENQKFMEKVEERRKLIYMPIPEFSKELGITAMQYCNIRDGRKSLGLELKHDIEILLEQKEV